MKTPAEHSIAIKPWCGNTRDYREYVVDRKYGRRFGQSYLRARWIRFGRHITYEMVEAHTDKDGFTEYGKVVSTGCRTLREVRETAYEYFYHVS